MTPAAGTLTAAEFDTLFDAFSHTVVRLEAREEYSVGGAEGERIAALRAGRPRPVRNVDTDPWLARIAVSTVTAGKAWRRVRVVDEPLTWYQRYQLDGYREAQACGDRVFLVPRSQVGDVGEDVWLFDEGGESAHAVWMIYNGDGSVDRRVLVTDPDQVAAIAANIARVSAPALPLNEFLAVAG